MAVVEERYRPLPRYRENVNFPTPASCAPPQLGGEQAEIRRSYTHYIFHKVSFCDRVVAELTAIGEPAAAHRPADGDGLHHLGRAHQRADPAGVISAWRDGLTAAQALGKPFT
jgi:hypothetical protein